MLTEEWRAVPGWETFYEISNFGNLRSLRHRGKPRKKPWPRKPSKSVRPTGTYLIATLLNSDRILRTGIHRLVLMAFVGPCPDGMEGRHLDGNPSNNRVENLAWGTKKENCADREGHGRTYRGERQHLSIFTEGEVAQIRRQFIVDGQKRADIVRMWVETKNCDPTVVRDIIGFRTWKHVRHI